MSSTELTALLLFCAAMSFSPGPNTTLAAALSVNHGLPRALRFCVAVPAGWTFLMLVCDLGLGGLVLGVPALRWAVKGLGVAALLRDFLSKGRRLLWFNRALALVLVATAGWMVVA